MAKQNNMMENLTFPTFLEILKEVLHKCECTVFVCYGSTTITPEDVRNEIIEENHHSLVAGHKGVTKTYKITRERFFWNGMKEQITEYIRNCKGCQELKLVRVKTKAPMIITDTLIKLFDTISIDTAGSLPSTLEGNKYILTIQDNLTKYCIAVPIPDTQAETIADALARHVMRHAPYFLTEPQP